MTLGDTDGWRKSKTSTVYEGRGLGGSGEDKEPNGCW